MIIRHGDNAVTLNIDNYQAKGESCTPCTIYWNYNPNNPTQEDVINELSPIYDINPNPGSQYLSLNITQNSSYICIDNLLETACYYDLTKIEALSIVNSIRKIVRENYKDCALRNGITENGIKYMDDAFELANGKDFEDKEI